MAGCLYREAGFGRVRAAVVYSPRFGGSPEPKIFGRWLVAWATAAVATAAVALRAEVSRACAAQAAFAP